MMYHIHPGDNFDIEHRLKFHTFAKSLLRHYIKNDHLFEKYIHTMSPYFIVACYKIFLKNDTFII